MRIEFSDDLSQQLEGITMPVYDDGSHIAKSGEMFGKREQQPQQITPTTTTDIQDIQLGSG